MTCQGRDVSSATLICSLSSFSVCLLSLVVSSHSSALAFTVKSPLAFQTLHRVPLSCISSLSLPHSHGSSRLARQLVHCQHHGCSLYRNTAPHKRSLYTTMSANNPTYSSDSDSFEPPPLWERTGFRSYDDDVAPFEVTKPNLARRSHHGVLLNTTCYPNKDDQVIMPWVGFGTYKLRKNQRMPPPKAHGFDIYKSSDKDDAEEDGVYAAVMCALRTGYFSIDTAFIYGGETVEASVGKAVNQYIDEVAADCSPERARKELFVTTKHWRAYHGYDKTMECLRKSLRRLQLDFVDLYLMHWPGVPPVRGGAKKKEEKKEVKVEDDVKEPERKKSKGNDEAMASDAAKATAEVVASSTEASMKTDEDYDGDDGGDGGNDMEDEVVALRAETWRAMEDAVTQGLARAIGVCNMNISHLETLKKTARFWPPAVLQIECHPLRPQRELLKYCKREGIVVTAYASLGGQDTGKKEWKKLLGGGMVGKKKEENFTLLTAPPLAKLAEKKGVAPSTILLRWGLQRKCVLIPKSHNPDNIDQNMSVFSVGLTNKEMQDLEDDLQALVRENNADAVNLDEITQLCWRNDPTRSLNFK
jgi:diketogulonate reductase-like aldo/keto reductase